MIEWNMGIIEELPGNPRGLGAGQPQSTETLKQAIEALRTVVSSQPNCSGIAITIFNSGSQQIEHLDAQYIYQNGSSEAATVKSVQKDSKESICSHHSIYDRIRHCISLLMQEKYSEQDGERTVIEPLFNQQSHWQAVYRDLVDKEYCEDSDFDGFDIFIRKSMPDKVNKPYSKASVKQISQTDFCRPFCDWKFDPETSKTRKPYDRMAAVAQRFLEIMKENGL